MDDAIAELDEYIDAHEEARRADKLAHPDAYVWVLTRTFPHPALATPAVYRRKVDAQASVWGVEARAVQWRQVGADPSHWQSYPLTDEITGQEVWWTLEECRIEGEVDRTREAEAEAEAEKE